jgi:hypothetical protein
MSVDLSIAPWNRLKKLAPSDATEDDLQMAADRWALTTDIYNAAADIWEEQAFAININPDGATTPLTDRKIQSVSQDGISVTYSNDDLIADSQSSRVAQKAQMLANVRQLRAKGKPTSPLVHAETYNPWTGLPHKYFDGYEFVNDETEIVIVVD